jgi:hypothetical protein
MRRSLKRYIWFFSELPFKRFQIKRIYFLVLITEAIYGAMLEISRQK